MDLNEENNIPAVKKDWTMRIVAINLALMVIYTIVFRSMTGNYLALTVGFFMAIQIVICLLTAIFFQPRAYLLSALAVLLIGFSTCVIAFSGNM